MDSHGRNRHLAKPVGLPSRQAVRGQSVLGALAAALHLCYICAPTCHTHGSSGVAYTLKVQCLKGFSSRGSNYPATGQLSSVGGQLDSYRSGARWQWSATNQPPWQTQPSKFNLPTGTQSPKLFKHCGTRFCPKSTRDPSLFNISDCKPLNFTE